MSNREERARATEARIAAARAREQTEVNVDQL